MAVTPFAANRFVLQNTLDVQSRTQDLRIQASTGKKSQSFAGIATEVRRLEGLESNLVANRAFQRNAERTELRLQEMESAVDTLADIASEFRTQLLSAANDGGNLDSIDLATIARTFRDEAVGVLNTELEGRFLFAGSATNTRPVDFSQSTIASFQDVKDGLYFQGTDDVLSARIKENVTLDYGVTADPNNGKGFHKLFTALSRVIENPNDPDAVEESIRDLSGGEAQATLGSDQIGDPDQALNAAVNFGAGSINDPQNLDINVDGTNVGPITVNADSDNLRDVANQIDALSSVTARVAIQEGVPQIEIFSDSGDPVSVSVAGAPANPLIGGGNLTQRNDVLVDGAIEELAETRSEIGASRGLVESTLSQLQDSQTRVEGDISDVEDVDLTRAMTLLAQNQSTLEVSFAVTARLQQTSLLNFLN